MRLFLVQHGEALTEAVDPARPLSAAGREDVERIAAWLSRTGLLVGRVVHSGKLRAEQTAALLAAAIAPGVAIEARAGLAPDDAIAPWAAEAGRWDRDVMVVGHLPFMARLASRLTAGREDAGVVAFRPGSVVCLEQTDQGHFALRWMLSPELIPHNP